MEERSIFQGLVKRLWPKVQRSRPGMVLAHNKPLLLTANSLPLVSRRRACRYISLAAPVYRCYYWVCTPVLLRPKS